MNQNSIHIEIAKSICEILKQLNIKHFIDFGTLLGAYRNQNILSHDYDFDIFYIHSKKLNFRKLFKNIIKKYKLKYMFTNAGENFNLIHEKFRFELYPCVIEEKFFYPFNLPNYKVPIFFIDELEEINIQEEKFYCPRHLKTYLTHRYGKNFMIPQLKTPDGKNWWEMNCNIINYKNNYSAYAAGVFDLFHIGHLKLFKRIKENFGKLIVGVHNDEDVMTYKNKPIIKYEQRLEIVKSIKYVDDVLENAPLSTTNELLKKLKCDFVIAGKENPDYIKKYYPVDDEKLHLIDRTKEISSSQIKKCIN